MGGLEPRRVRVVAHATHPQALDDLIRDAGEDPEKCLIEGIPVEDGVIGSVEFGSGLL